MIWNMPIKADGFIASAHQQAVAWDAWVARGGGYYNWLATELAVAGVPNRPPFCTCARVADRMLQKARKAGAVRFVKGRWEIAALSSIPPQEADPT